MENLINIQLLKARRHIYLEAKKEYIIGNGFYFILHNHFYGNLDMTYFGILNLSNHPNNNSLDRYYTLKLLQGINGIKTDNSGNSIFGNPSYFSNSLPDSDPYYHLQFNPFKCSIRNNGKSGINIILFEFITH